MPVSLYVLALLCKHRLLYVASIVFFQRIDTKSSALKDMVGNVCVCLQALSTISVSDRLLTTA